MLLRAAWLTAVLLAAYSATVPVLASRFGPAVWSAAAAAAFVCWTGALVSMILATAAKRPQAAYYGLLLGLINRMGLALAAAIVVDRQFAPWRDAGFVGFLVGFYLLSLFVETLLVIPVVRSQATVAKGRG